MRADNEILYKRVSLFVRRGNYSPADISKKIGESVYIVSKMMSKYIQSIQREKIVDDRVDTDYIKEEDFNYESTDLPAIRFENLIQFEDGNI